ncbi:MobA/MobL family protein [Hyphobacterium sp.]|uniref:MobA/MobL family protein n=1 Tax=Hyphobacterium sp. TaxID=2004662 RepID=UPI003BABB44E
MALYSLNVSSIGRTTHAAGTAGAHIRYICREDAEPEIFSGGGLPIDPLEARNFLDRGERADRINARVADKIRAALPIELDHAQRAELVRDFAAQLSEGRVPWFAAIHQTGEDEHNPHVHLLIRDRDKETGKRVIRLSDSARDWKAAGRPGEAPCSYVRELWENAANEALERAGHSERIDRRTLEAQGIDREPQIHLGPAGQYVETHKHRPHSKDVKEKSWRRTQYRDRTPYEQIDQGRTRRERNDEIIDLNLERAARSKHEKTRQWALFEKEQRAKDLALSAQHKDRFRRQRYERDEIAAKFKSRRQDTQIRREAEMDFVRESLRVAERRKLTDLAQRHQLESSALRSEQKRWSARLMRYIDISGRTKKSQEAAVMRLGNQQTRERRKAEREIRSDEKIQTALVNKRYAPELLDVRRERRAALSELSARHKIENAPYQASLQAREIERERARQKLTSYLNERLSPQSTNAAGSQEFDRRLSAYDSIEPIDFSGGTQRSHDFDNDRER